MPHIIRLRGRAMVGFFIWAKAALGQRVQILDQIGGCGNANRHFQGFSIPDGFLGGNSSREWVVSAVIPQHDPFRQRMQKVIPSPPNPYRIHGCLTGSLGLVGLAALDFCGWEPSRAHPLVFLIGVGSVTVAVLAGVGVVCGWRWFVSRFGSDGLLACWEVIGGEWEGHSENLRKRTLALRKFLWAGPCASALMLGLGHSDGDWLGILPFALLFGGMLSASIGVVIALQLHSLAGNGARVWLAKHGVMVNRNVFFHDTCGMRTFAWEMKPEHGRHLLVIRYEVRSGKAVGEHEMLVPVPAEYRGLVEDTVRSWVSAG